MIIPKATKQIEEESDDDDDDDEDEKEVDLSQDWHDEEEVLGDDVLEMLRKGLRKEHHDHFHNEVVKLDRRSDEALQGLTDRIVHRQQKANTSRAAKGKGGANLILLYGSPITNDTI